MTISEILAELTTLSGKFPLEAMQEALAQRDAITPELLRVVEEVAENPSAYSVRSDYMLTTHALFLLAQFRETRAYPALIKIVSTPEEMPFDLLGDTISEGLSRLLASVYDGNPAPLKGLVEGDQFNDFVRSAAIDTFLVLENTGQMTRAEVIEYFKSLFHGSLKRNWSYVWSSLICAVADLPAPELLDEVRQAYEDGIVDTSVIGLKGVERYIQSPRGWRREQLTLITDSIEEMDWWACFQPDDDQYEPELDTEILDQDIPVVPGPEYSESPRPFVRGTKTGRNEPCPCGSGKKFKKCCGK